MLTDWFCNGQGLTVQNLAWMRPRSTCCCIRSQNLFHSTFPDSKLLWNVCKWWVGCSIGTAMVATPCAGEVKGSRISERSTDGSYWGGGVVVMLQALFSRTWIEYQPSHSDVADGRRLSRLIPGWCPEISTDASFQILICSLAMISFTSHLMLIISVTRV
jgi:hypothetical protein